MANLTLPQGTVKIGDTLFVNGTPYKQCGHCGIPIKQFDGDIRVVAGRDKKSREIRPFKITLLLGWDRIEELAFVDGFQTILVKHRPKLLQALGCLECWSKQQSLRARFSKIGDWAFDIRLRPK